MSNCCCIVSVPTTERLILSIQLHHKTTTIFIWMLQLYVDKTNNNSVNNFFHTTENYRTCQLVFPHYKDNIAFNYIDIQLFWIHPNRYRQIRLKSWFMSNWPIRSRLIRWIHSCSIHSKLNQFYWITRELN